MGSPGRVVEGPYLRDILAQPAALRATLHALETMPTGLAEVVRRIDDRDIDQVVLTGMGSSFHALHPLHLGLVRQGVRSSMVETSELLHYQAGLVGPQTALVVVSQSGRSAETVRLLERATSGTLVAVTNTENSPLARRADVTVLTRAGEEASVSCKTYLTALAALAWLESVLDGADAESARSALESAAVAVGEYLESWRTHVADLSRQLRGVDDLFLVGRGVSLAAAGAGGLIVKESTRVHAEGMSSAAFRHGPMELISESCFVLVFDGLEPTRELNRRLAADVQSAGGRSAVVGESASEGCLRLPPAPPEMLPALEILPVEMITLALAALRGREAGCFRLASKVTAAE